MDTALLSFVGIIVGATLQYLFTRHLDARKHQRDLRTKAYTDYLLCVSEHANLAKARHTAEGRELGSKTADAKCRVCLYGAPAVVAAFAAFERQGAGMATAEQRAAFTDLVRLMRLDSSTGTAVDLDDLQVVLLGAGQPKN